MTQGKREIVNHPSAWRRADLLQDQSWIYQLESEDLQDVERALRAVQKQDRIWGEFPAADFPLPTLAAKLRRIQAEIRNGRGVVLVRGFPTTRYDRDELKTIYWGLGCHFGTVISNNTAGDFVSAVTNRPDMAADANRRLNTTNQLLDPHTDPSDIVMLLSIEKALQGGLSSLASATAVYNEILRTHPEYLDVLHRGFRRDARGNGPTGDPNEVSAYIPVYDYANGELSCSYGRKVIVDGAKKAGAPLSESELAAVDAIRDLALSDELRVDMMLEPGDIQIINNFRTLHSRSAYVDHPDGRKRYLLRMWINVEGPSLLSAEFAAYVRRGILPRAGRSELAVGGGALSSLDPNH
jgi:Taurine catabolism dioxygenase TauD, TfdA family